MKNSASKKSTADSAKQVVPKLERRDRQSSLLEFMNADTGNEIDSLKKLRHKESDIRP